MKSHSVSSMPTASSPSPDDPAPPTCRWPDRPIGPIRPSAAQLGRSKEVIYIGVETVVALVLGTATLVVAILSLVVKIIELSRH